jgi:hypothetical protein
MASIHSAGGAPTVVVDAEVRWEQKIAYQNFRIRVEKNTNASKPRQMIKLQRY